MPDSENTGRADLPESGTVARPFTLTKRQTECLTWAAKGHSLAMIARELVVEYRTVRTHLQQARRRLGAFNTTHAVAIAIREGLVVYE